MTVSIKIIFELIVLVPKQLKFTNFLEKQLLNFTKRNSRIKSENILTYAQNYLFTIGYRNTNLNHFRSTFYSHTPVLKSINVPTVVLNMLKANNKNSKAMIKDQVSLGSFI